MSGTNMPMQVSISSFSPGTRSKPKRGNKNKILKTPFSCVKKTDIFCSLQNISKGCPKQSLIKASEKKHREYNKKSQGQQVSKSALSRGEGLTLNIYILHLKKKKEYRNQGEQDRGQSEPQFDLLQRYTITHIDKPYFQGAVCLCSSRKEKLFMGCEIQKVTLAPLHPVQLPLLEHSWSREIQLFPK